MGDAQAPRALDLWRSIERVEEAAGHDAQQAAAAFTRRMSGLAPAEAAVMELEFYLEGLDSSGEWISPSEDRSATHRATHFTFTPGAGHSDLADSESWVRVEDGGLDQPIYVKFARVGPAFRVTALHVDNGAEITSRSLRFRLRRIAEEFVGDWTESGPSERARYELKDDPGSLWLGWAFMDQYVREHVPTEAPPRGRGSGAPTVDELKIFARMYLEEVTERPRGAVTRTANRYGMHRVTAHTWIKQCRAHGLLPEEDR